MELKWIIETKNVSKKYGTQLASNNISLQIEQGKVYGLIGPNGAGKTTIMKMLAGLSIPTQGEVYFYGKTGEAELASSRKKMSFMIETPYVRMTLNAKQNLEMQRLQRGVKDKHRIDEVLEIVGLKDVGNKLVKQFSLGMRQRLGIANALLVRPEVMVLDEPVNGLDPEGMAEIRELILKLNQQEKVTIIISSHILTELSQMCSDYIFINSGTVVEEISQQNLFAKCKRHFCIRTDQNEKSAEIMSNVLKTDKFLITEDGTCELYDHLDEPYQVARSFIDRGITPIHFCEECESLEDYYLSLVGGKDHE